MAHPPSDRKCARQVLALKERTWGVPLLSPAPPHMKKEADLTPAKLYPNLSARRRHPFPFACDAPSTNLTWIVMFAPSPPSLAFPDGQEEMPAPSIILKAQPGRPHTRRVLPAQALPWAQA